MNSLYTIITELQQASGSNAKLAILQEHKDNELLKKYVEATLSPRLNYFFSKKTFPKVDKIVKEQHKELNEQCIQDCVSTLAGREMTGYAAFSWLRALLESHSMEGQQLIEWMILKDFRAGVGEALVSKVWPEFKWLPAYQRCSLMDEKAIAHFSKPDTKMIVQEKMDGSFAYLIMNEHGEPTLMTRNGSVYPKEFAKHIADNLIVGSCVFVGELVGFTSNGQGNDCPVPRKMGNGALNSIQQGNTNYFEDVHEWGLVCWDLLPLSDFNTGICNRPYVERFSLLVDNFYKEEKQTNIRIVEHLYDVTLEEANEFYQRQLAQGKEGAVLKDLNSTWKDGTSKLNVKMKLSVDIDLVVWGFVEGTGKASGMLGALQCMSSDTEVECDVGTGFTERDRGILWDNRDAYIGKIVQIKANDLLTNKKDSGYSLFLPVFQEIRFDKSQADSLERIKEIFNAAKKGE